MAFYSHPSRRKRQYSTMQFKKMTGITTK